VWQCGQATATVDTLVAMSPAKRSWFTLPLPRPRRSEGCSLVQR
jgi:hypothetical protein